MKKKPITLSSRAELKLPVGRIRRKIIDEKYASRVSLSAALAVAAVTEYLMQEIIENSSYQCVQKGVKRILPRHIMLGIQNDDDLKTAFVEMVFSGAGAMVNRRAQLFAKKSSKAAIAES